jgi:hypothetical protein
MMEKIVVTLTSGFHATACTQGWEIPSTWGADEVDEFVRYLALVRAESFNVYPYPQYHKDWDDSVTYSVNIEGTWEGYDENNKEHTYISVWNQYE